MAIYALILWKDSTFLVSYVHEFTLNTQNNAIKWGLRLWKQKAENFFGLHWLVEPDQKCDRNPLTQPQILIREHPSYNGQGEAIFSMESKQMNSPVYLRLSKHVRFLGTQLKPENTYWIKW